MQHRMPFKQFQQRELHAKNKAKDLLHERKLEKQRSPEKAIGHKSYRENSEPAKINKAGVFFLLMLLSAELISTVQNPKITKPSPKKASLHNKSSFFLFANAEHTSENVFNISSVLDTDAVVTEDVVGSALYKHIHPFLDAEGRFSAETIAKQLRPYMSPGAAIAKGHLIDIFNSIHGGGHGPITPRTDLSKTVHTGTARIWTTQGEFNETAWKDFIDYTASTQQTPQPDRIYASTWESYIAKIDKEQGVQPHTGRYSCIPGGLAMQKFAGSAARQQILDLIAKDDNDGKGRYMTAEDAELFYRDTGKLLQNVGKQHEQKKVEEGSKHISPKI